MRRSHQRLSFALALWVTTSAALSCAGTGPEPVMIPAERISREPVPEAFMDVPIRGDNWRAECHLLFESMQTARAVQLAGVGLTTLGIVGALLAGDDEVAQTASQIATAAGMVTQLGAGTVADVKARSAYERGCVD